MKTSFAWLLVTIFAPTALYAAEPCDAFEWDVHAERALLAGPAADLQAGTDATSAPALTFASAYRLQLAPQGSVHFAPMPAKKTLAEGASGGVVRILLAKAGRYRVSLDAPAWIDVIQSGQIVPSRAFQGRQGCSTPHKVVEYDLLQGDTLIQLSAAPSSTLRITMTSSPPGT